MAGLTLAQVCPYDLGEHGGVQSQVLGLARALHAQGHQVTVVGPGHPPEGDLPCEVISLGHSVSVEANGSLAPIAFDLASAARSLALLRRRRFELLHLHEPLVPGPTMAMCIAAGVPTVGTFHLAGASASYRYLGPIVRWMARQLDCRCCVSEEARRTAEEYLGGSYAVLFNGVDTAAWSARRSGQVRRSNTIAFVGRHEARKGLQILIDAVGLLRRDYPEPARSAVLRIAGEGPDTESLRRRSEGLEGIEWLGSPDDQGVIDLVSGASVLCAPSLSGESFGIVLAEAMAAGTPVVASDIPGYRAVAGEGSAVLVPPGDPAALAHALDRVLTHGEAAAALAVAGRDRAARYSMEALADEYVEIYRSLLKPGRASGTPD